MDIKSSKELIGTKWSRSIGPQTLIVTIVSFSTLETKNEKLMVTYQYKTVQGLFSKTWTEFNRVFNQE